MLGRTVQPSEYGALEVFPVDRPVRVTFTTNELQALCPAVEGIQPDIYEARISYTAATHAIESKSLKLMLVTYRDKRIFAENLVGDIADRRRRASVTDLDLFEIAGRLGTTRRGLGSPGLGDEGPGCGRFGGGCFGRLGRLLDGLLWRRLLCRLVGFEALWCADFLHFPASNW